LEPLFGASLLPLVAGGTVGCVECSLEGIVERSLESDLPAFVVSVPAFCVVCAMTGATISIAAATPPISVLVFITPPSKRDVTKRTTAIPTRSEIIARERGAYANLEALADQWLALEVKVVRVVCNDEVLSWFSKPIFEQPVTLH
jgi:hypothetical protein